MIGAQILLLGLLGAGVTPVSNADTEMAIFRKQAIESMSDSADHVELDDWTRIVVWRKPDQSDIESFFRVDGTDYAEDGDNKLYCVAGQPVKVQPNSNTIPMTGYKCDFYTRVFN